MTFLFYHPLVPDDLTFTWGQIRRIDYPGGVLFMAAIVCGGIGIISGLYLYPW